MSRPRPTWPKRPLAATVLPAVLFFSLAAPVQSVHAAGVYVAGQGFSLDQAVGQALAEQGGNERFWVVASGEAARRVAAPDAGTRELLARVQARGGLVYLCGRDLPSGTDVAQLPGVGVVSATRSGESAILPPEKVEEETVPESMRQNRLILRACAALQ